MNLKRLLVVGSSGHAASVTDVVEQMGGWQIVGLLDGFAAKGKGRLGFVVLGTPDEVESLTGQHAIDGLIVAIGDNFQRRKLVERIRSLAPDIPLVTAIHPRSVVGRNVSVGAG